MQHISRTCGWRSLLLAGYWAVMVFSPQPGYGNPLANPFPRSFTDDPFVDDEKFIEIGKSCFLLYP
jgi:hypothetical protein